MLRVAFVFAWLAAHRCSASPARNDTAAAAGRALAERDQFDRLRLAHPGLKAKPRRRPRKKGGIGGDARRALLAAPTAGVAVGDRVALGGGTMPALVYGTAWKEDRTADLVVLALEAGYAGVDTATAKKHYDEAGVGAGVRGHPKVWLQSKFTYARGHEAGSEPWPADADAGARVAASLEASLRNLGAERLDAYLLHGPSSEARRTGALSAEDRATWAAIGRLKREGKDGAGRKKGAAAPVKRD